MEIIFGTTSKRKLSDLQNIIDTYYMNIKVLSMNDIGWNKGEIEETGTTLEENSYIKAKAIWDFCQERELNIPIITDDAGLFVEALNGEPGVRTSRYAEEEMETDPSLPEYEGINKLLRNMKESTNRKAYYKSVVTLMMPDGTYFTEEGISEGQIAEDIIGPLTKPYYYAIFMLDGYDKAFNELTDEELTETYRYNAMRRILEKIPK